MRFAAILFFTLAITSCGSKSNDLPSDASNAVKEASENSAENLSELSLKEIFDRTQQLNQRQRQLEADMQRDIDETKARLGARVNDPSANSEAIRIRQTWPPQIQGVEAEMELLSQELRRRCPRGASLSAAHQSCN